MLRATYHTNTSLQACIPYTSPYVKGLLLPMKVVEELHELTFLRIFKNYHKDSFFQLENGGARSGLDEMNRVTNVKK